MTVIERRQERNDTATAWTAVNPVLALAEVGVESDTGKWKLGDGVTAWTSLAYQVTAAGVALMIPLAQRGAANGVATLDAGSKIPSAQLPALAVNDTFTVASQAAMLALTAQRGDVAVRTDLTPAGFFLLTTDDPTVVGNWVQITAPGAVTTVNGRAGTVTGLAEQTSLDATNIQVTTNTAAISTETANRVAADKVLPSTQVTADYTPVLGDAGKSVQVNAAGPVTVTIPANATVAYPVDTILWVSRVGAGAVTVVGSGGVTLVTGGAISVQGAAFRLHYRGSDTWSCRELVPAGVLDARYSAKGSLVYVATDYGMVCDGTTDDSTAFLALLNTVSAAGGGSIYLPRLARINSQITMPTTDSATQRSMAPIRIFGAGADRPGQARSAIKYPNVGGLDLRYAGRTDTSCATNLGSCLVTNTSAVAGDAGQIVTGPGIAPRTYILASTAGVGWTLDKAARATASGVSLNLTGGKLQGFGLGTLEIDHLVLTDQGVSSSPFIVATGANLHLHDCAVVGNPSKSGNACDQDIALLGGAGQGSALTVALTSGNTYTSITVAPIPTGILPGATIVINQGGGTTQAITPTSACVAGQTAIPCTSFVANANYPVRTGVAFRDWQTASDPTCLAVPAAPMQGYSSAIHDNYFNRVRSIYAGCWASDFSIRRNTPWVDCGSNLAAVPSTLTTGLTAGGAITALAVTALSRAVIAGDTIQVGTGGTALIATASADAAAGATSIAVNSITPTIAYAIGVVVFDPTAGLGAFIESYGVGGSANQIVAYDNRFEMAGGYNYATIFSGPTYNSFLGFNNVQDANASNLATHRFQSGSQYNTIIPSIKANAAVPLTDDVTGPVTSQTTLAGNQSMKSTFPQGIAAGATTVTDITFTGVSGPIAAPNFVITTNPPSSTACFTLKDNAGQTWIDVSQTSGITAFRGPVNLAGGPGGAGSTALTVGNNSTASDAIINLNAPTGQTNQIQIKRAGVNSWLIYDANSTSLFVRDSVNGVMALTFSPGTGVTGRAEFGGYIRVLAKKVEMGSGGAQWLSGTGTPEGAKTAPIGSLYSREDGGAGTTLYVKESGAGNTGWRAV